MVALITTPPSSQRTLRNATHHLHRRVESRLGLVSPDLTRREYVDTLRGFLVAYEALEDSLEGHATGLAKIGLDWPSHRKASLLRADLAALHGSVADASAMALDVPDLPTLAAALGCMYVMEGATLGGAVIRRHVAKTLRIGPENGAAFFAGYGDAVGARWEAFRTTLDRVLTDFVALEQAADSAVASFALIDACLTHTRQP